MNGNLQWLCLQREDRQHGILGQEGKKMGVEVEVWIKPIRISHIFIYICAPLSIYTHTYTVMLCITMLQSMMDYIYEWSHRL